ncbi:MAG: hypothetical protein ABEJ73_12500 [Haloplanus sp.]
MNVEELRTVQRTERQKDSLQHLRDSFYRDVAEYLADRKAERKRVADEVDNPFSSPEVTRISDEIQTAEEVVESIYERRIGKIVKRATFAAAGMATEDEGLTREERELFDDLVARIETNRETVLDTLIGDADTGESETDTDTGESETDTDTDTDTGESETDTDTDTGESETDTDTDTDTGESETDTETEPVADPTPDSAPPAGPSDREAEPTPDPDDLLAEAMGGDDSGDTDEAGADSDPSSPASAEATPPRNISDDETSVSDDGDAAAVDTERTTLRITRDVGEILGVDEREYDLASEDVVTLPTPNAEPLLNRDAAERLDDT